MSVPEQLPGCLALLLPILVSRLGSGEVTEPSEELRLQLLCLLSSLVEAASSEMAPYLDDMILILQRTIVDPYPELKKVRVVWVLTTFVGGMLLCSPTRIEKCHPFH